MSMSACDAGAPSNYSTLRAHLRERLVLALLKDPDLEGWQISERFGLPEGAATEQAIHRARLIIRRGQRR